MFPRLAQHCVFNVGVLVSAGKAAPWEGSAGTQPEVCGQALGAVVHPNQNHGRNVVSLALFGGDPGSSQALPVPQPRPAGGARPKAVKGWELVQLVAGREDAGWDLAGTPLPLDAFLLRRSARWWCWVGGCWGHDYAMVHLQIPLPRPPSETVLRRSGWVWMMSQGRRIAVPDLLALPLNPWRALSLFAPILQRRSRGSAVMGFPRSRPGHTGCEVGPPLPLPPGVHRMVSSPVASQPGHCWMWE